MRLATSPVEKEAAKETLLRSSFAQALRDARFHRGIRSQAALAEMSGVPEYVVGALERGEKPIDLKVIAKLCNGMRMSPGVFLEEVRQIQLHLLLPVTAKLEAGGAGAQEASHSAALADLHNALDSVVQAVTKLFSDLLKEHGLVQRAMPFQEAQLRKAGRKRRGSAPEGQR